MDRVIGEYADERAIGSRPDGRVRRDVAAAAARGALAALWLVTLASVAGFALFGVNPSMLERFPDALPVYAAMYRWMPIGQVALAFGVMVVLLRASSGWSWLGAFGLVYVASLASELVGTTWGIPFGEYGYRSGLGPMWLDRVPVVIPLSWFYMAVASYALVRVAQRGVEGRAASRIVLGAALLTAWDLSLDPAMSAATSFWWWGEAGPYYGMPLLNIVGWFATSLVLMGALRFADADRWLGRVPASWMGGFYAANLFLAMGMAAAGGMWWALLVTGVAIAGVFAAARRDAAGER